MTTLHGEDSSSAGTTRAAASACASLHVHGPRELPPSRSPYGTRLPIHNEWDQTLIRCVLPLSWLNGPDWLRPYGIGQIRASPITASPAQSDSNKDLNMKFRRFMMLPRIKGLFFFRPVLQITSDTSTGESPHL